MQIVASTRNVACAPEHDTTVADEEVPDRTRLEGGLTIGLTDQKQTRNTVNLLRCRSEIATVRSRTGAK